MKGKAAGFSRSKLLDTVLSVGAHELDNHSIEVTETRSNGQDGEFASSNIFGYVSLAIPYESIPFLFKITFHDLIE